MENDFRITKADMDARPVYLKRDDRIKAHFLSVDGEGYIRSIIASTKKREKETCGQ